MSNSHPNGALSALERVADALQEGQTPELVWQTIEQALTQVYGQRLFTVLAYDEQSRRLGRLHSNRPDINPVGGFKRVTESRWVDHVLHRGEIFVGSTREDIKAVFSEYEVLWSIGCESVLNIPVRKNGLTIGTMNLLAGAGQYDHADVRLAVVFAQLAVAPFEACLDRLRELGEPDHMEQV
ncbi:GAF domain-containing protein [Paraburkholderia aromaticivorans]|uniref:GAF domain-containing protein n=1 Tax=Paraburkholderia aromaticivorans TaxID=2026199 RepID=A0A248VRE5_9BURK|nr:GAF domain-containing protein [Paraburkholderia aromaticivorans]ASW00930.1 GAF domain-containing protein [Paraburkholderia aromaticivorans]